MSDEHLGGTAVVVATATYAVYTAITCLRPIPYRDDSRVRALIAFEQVLCTVLILATGSWSSPFALCLVPAGMLAGFAAGWLFSSELAACAVATITLQDVIVNDAAHRAAARCRVVRAPRAWWPSPAASRTDRHWTAPASSDSRRIG